MVLARVLVRFELWPKEVEDYSFDLQTASNVVAPPTLVGELVKLDKGPAMESIKSKHYLRPFILDVYQVDFNFWLSRGEVCGCGGANRETSPCDYVLAGLVGCFRRNCTMQ